MNVSPAGHAGPHVLRLQVALRYRLLTVDDRVHLPIRWWLGVSFARAPRQTSSIAW